MYQSFSRMNASLVAEYLSFKPTFPFNVAMYRVNEATYLCFVAMLLFDATVKRMDVATLVCFVASTRTVSQSTRASLQQSGAALQ